MQSIGVAARIAARRLATATSSDKTTALRAAAAAIRAPLPTSLPPIDATSTRPGSSISPPRYTTGCCSTTRASR